MELYIFIFIGLLIGTFVLSYYFQVKNEKIDRRREQSRNILRENIIKDRIEEYAEKNVSYKKKKKIEIMLLQAGYNLTYIEYLIISLISAVVMFFGVLFIMHNPFLAVGGIFIGFILPNQVFMFIKNKRIEAMDKQIGPFMNMMNKRYETSKDLKKAFELTMEEFKGEEPIYSELKKTYLDLGVGVSINDALDGLGLRSGNKFLMRFADYARIANELGTEVARTKILTQAYYQYEDDRKVKSLLKKEISGVKNEAFIMIAAIPAFAVFQIATSDTYIPFMRDTLIGQIGLVVIMTIFIGSLWVVNNVLGKPID